MIKIDIHNQVGGVGSTTIAAHMIAGAQEIGIRVAALSLDPTRALARELEGAGVPVLEPGGEFDAETDLLVIDRSTQHREPVDADVRVIPIRDRRSWEVACDLSDRHSAPVLWVPSMTERALEVPLYLQGVVQVTPAIPRSHAIALAEWRRRVVWTDPDLAASAGAHAMRVAVFDLLRRAMGPEIVLGQPSAALPIEPGASATLRHGPRPGFRIAQVSPELRFGGDDGLDASAELQLLHLDGGQERALATWAFGEPPPRPRDLLQRPQVIGIGDGLLLRITNTGRRPITEARLRVDDDPSLEVPLPRRRHTPREHVARDAAVVHHAIAQAQAEVAAAFARTDAEAGV